MEKDRDILRNLASRLKEMSELPVMSERKRQWTADNPEGLKRLMRFMSDEMSHFMDQLEELDILGYNNGNHLIGSGNWGLTSDLPSKRNPLSEASNGKVRPYLLWLLRAGGGAF